MIDETETDCFAWTLIPNHFHLLLHTGTTPLSKMTSRLFFKNRYKSILCQEDVYLKKLLRYIHLNPLREGLVRRPELTGGGLLHSIGGWTALKSFRKTGIRIKEDEHILGNSDFV